MPDRDIELSTIDRLMRRVNSYSYNGGNGRTAEGLLFRGVGMEELGKVRDSNIPPDSMRTVGHWWSAQLYHANRYRSSAGALLVSAEPEDLSPEIKGALNSGRLYEVVCSRKRSEVLAAYATREGKMERVWTNPTLGSAIKIKSYSRKGKRVKAHTRKRKK